MWDLFVILNLFLFNVPLYNWERKNAELSRIGNSITMGYISADLLIILLSYKHIGDLFTVTHHLMAIWAYYFVVVYGLLPYFANFRQLAEISTPFVNQRWFFDAIGRPRTCRSSIINGYVLGVSFFLCRIVVMPMYYNSCYVAWGTQQQKELGGLVSFYWISTSVVLDVINLYWFSKIVRGAMKITRNLKERKEGWFHIRFFYKNNVAYLTRDMTLKMFHPEIL